MSEHLFAIQDANGREVCSWKGEVKKFGDVSTTADVDKATIRVEGLGIVAVGETKDSALPLTLLRWPADDKLSDPVTHPVE